MPRGRRRETQDHTVVQTVADRLFSSPPCEREPEKAAAARKEGKFQRACGRLWLLHFNGLLYL